MNSAASDRQRASKTRFINRKRRRGTIGGLIAAVLLAFAFTIANQVWNRASSYYKRAAYIANCLPTVKPPATQAECSRLATAPDHLEDDTQLGDVTLTDQALTLSYASTLHSTGMAVMTLGGIVGSLVVGMTGLVVAATKEET